MGVVAQGQRETVLHMKALKGEGHQRSRFSQPAWGDVYARDQLDQKWLQSEPLIMSARSFCWIFLNIYTG